VKLLGLTATPTRTEESKRGWLWRLFPQGIIHQAEVKDLIAAGVLARPRLKEPVHTHVDAKLASADAGNRRKSDENAKVLRAFKAGELDVIINIRMLTEGTDVPDAQTVFLTRQTTSQILLTQMIGRALRGPKFGGTPEANIVAFIDDWKHRIQWAQFELEDLPVEAETPVARKYQPLQLVSIELVRRLARQKDRGENVKTLPFLTYLPIGWYDAQFLAPPPPDAARRKPCCPSRPARHIRGVLVRRDAALLSAAGAPRTRRPTPVRPMARLGDAAAARPATAGLGTSCL